MISKVFLIKTDKNKPIQMKNVVLNIKMKQTNMNKK